MHPSLLRRLRQGAIESTHVMVEETQERMLQVPCITVLVAVDGNRSNLNQDPRADSSSPTEVWHSARAPGRISRIPVVTMARVFKSTVRPMKGK